MAKSLLGIFILGVGAFTTGLAPAAENIPDLHSFIPIEAGAQPVLRLDPVEETCTDTRTHICVPKADLRHFILLAQERQCLSSEPPTVDMDRIIVVTDEQGRIFYTGGSPEVPYTMRLKWCHYEIVVASKVDVLGAMKEPEYWGFRFRPKWYLGYMPLTVLLNNSDFKDGIDTGLALDFFHVGWANLGVTAGFRGIGAAVGADLTSNFGLSAGYEVGFEAPFHNVNTSLYFAF